ncbi:hypothetical protein B0H10DRAFT_2232034 [Mycena sp. CBHHK59/15]|nr:hypothetical protein B0H10DRAFT_2232034 [Mycena sp. CBHHK59/15]
MLRPRNPLRVQKAYVALPKKAFTRWYEVVHGVVWACAGSYRLESLKESNRKKVMEATSSGSFWKEVKKLADPKPGPISVTAASLKDVFEKRLNLPEVLPKQFDSPQHSINKILSNLLPAETEDHTPEGFFTEK